MNELVRIVVADEHDLLREALVQALHAEPGLSVSGSAADGSGAVELVQRVRPDVALLSATLQDPLVAETCATIKNSDRVPRVIVVSPTPDPETLLAAVEAGADGFVSDDEELADLVSAIRRVHRGEAVVPSRMLGSLLRGLIVRRRRDDWASERYQRLTRREKEVLELLADGSDHQAVAEILFISPQTARTHIQNVLTKLEVHSRLEAAAFAAEHGLFESTGIRGAR